MTPERLTELQTALGLRNGTLSRLVDADRRTVQRWASGSRPIPRPVELLLRVMVASPEARAFINAAAFGDAKNSKS